MEFLHKQLLEIVKEWTDHLRKFDHVSPELDVNSIDSDFNNCASILIKIMLRSVNKDYFPFIVSLGYINRNDHTNIVLKVKYSSKISTDLLFGGLKEDDPKARTFDNELIEGEHVFDKEFIFWKLNDLLKKWMISDSQNT